MCLFSIVNFSVFKSENFARFEESVLHNSFEREREHLDIAVKYFKHIYCFLFCVYCLIHRHANLQSERA